MKSRKVLLAVGVLTLSLCPLAFAAEGDPNPKPAPAQPAQPARPALGGIGGGGANPWAPGAGAAYGRSGLWQTVNLISELNMTPDFTLSAEQKQKIQSVRDAARKEQDSWREAHAAEFKGFQEQMMAIRGNDPTNREKWQEIGKAQAELMATMPKEDEAVAQLKAVLTNEQLKRLDAEADRKRAEAERMQREMMERFKNPAAAPGAGR